VCVKNFLNIIYLIYFSLQPTLARLPEDTEPIKTNISSTLFGNVLITGEVGKRKIYLRNDDNPQLLLIDEEQLIKDLQKLPMTIKERAAIIAEAKENFGDFPKAISQTGNKVSNSHNQVIEDFASAGSGQEALNGPTHNCEGGEPEYYDNPEEFQYKEERTGFMMPVTKGFFDYINGKHEGPMSLGKLVAISSTLDTLNDNPLHGGVMAMGMTEFNEGVEGDDRGLTFGMNQEFKAEFEKGSISLAFFSNLYSRLSAQPKANGGGYTFFNSENGHYYAENLIHEGITVSFEKTQNEGYFMRLEGEISRIDDLKGVALDAQEMWHDQWDENTIVYEPVEHFSGQRIVKAQYGIGKEEDLYKSENFRLTGRLEGGVFASNYGNVADKYNASVTTNAGRLGAADKIEGVENFGVYGKAELMAQYRGFDASVYHHTNTNSAQATGFETGYTFNRQGKHQVRMFVGMGETENPFTKVYQNDDGGIEKSHNVGLTYRYKF
jgi:hypothetical protein